MKRREFLRASSGVALGFPMMMAGAKPCPPPLVTSSGGGSVNTTCGSGSVGPAPAWFTNMQAGTWATVAGGSGQRIQDCLPSPQISNGPGQVAGDPGSITSAWTGGAVDQTRGEYMLCANGGHADYAGNECYSLSLRDATPAWRRLTDPTPQSHILFDGNVGPNGAVNADGRPRAMHSTFECFGDGSIWYPEQNSFSSPSGGTAHAVISFNRDSLGAATSPLPWSASTLGPWTLHPKPNFSGFDSTATLFGRADFDRVGHKVWAVGGNNNVNSPFYWSVNTNGSNLGQSTVYRKGGSLDNFNSWIAVAHDLRIMVVGGNYGNRIWVFYLDRAGQSNDWESAANVSGTGTFESGAGAVYVQANYSLAVGNPKTMGSSIRKLQIPTRIVNSQVQYDPTGTWIWSTLNPTGANVTVPNTGGNDSTYSKWNIVEDMGNGQSAIVVATNIAGPTFVYKVPTGGI